MLSRLKGSLLGPETGISPVCYEFGPQLLWQKDQALTQHYEKIPSTFFSFHHLLQWSVTAQLGVYEHLKFILVFLHLYNSITLILTPFTVGAEPRVILTFWVGDEIHKLRPSDLYFPVTLKDYFNSTLPPYSKIESGFHKPWNSHM